jgi:hypothetical protein
VTTGALRRVLQPADGNCQDDSPAPAMRDSVTMVRQKVTDEGDMQLAFSTDEQ